MKSDFVVRESIPDAMAVQQAIVDASPLPSVIVRCSDGAILCANQGYIELLGLAPRTVLDGNVVDGHADADEWAAIVEHLESAEPVCGLRAAIKTSGGATVSTAVAAKLLTHAGEPAVICSYFDISEQKQIEKSLQVSEQRFRDFSQAGSDWFWEFDINHRFNTYYSNVTKPPDEWGITRYERASLEDRESNPEKWRRHLRDLDAHRPFRDFVYSIKDSGKSRLWVRTSGLPVFDEAGKFAGYRGTGTDITNQVKAEQRARSAETRLFDAIERFSGSVVLFDADDCLMVANRKWREFNEKVAAATETGANWTDYFRALLDAGVFPDAIGREDEWFEQRAEMRRDPKGPQEFRRSDGGWVLIDDLRLPDGSTLSVATDITKQKSAEEALRESEQRRLDFAQAGSDWFWETDAEHRFLEAGKGDVIRPTSPAHPSIGNTRYENASPWDRARDPEKWKDHLRDLNEHRPFRNFEYAFDAPDGIRHWLRISGVPVLDKADKFTGYRGIATNITDEINTEERAKSAQQRFASAIENISDMIAVWDADMKFVVANKSFFAIHDTVNVRPHVGMDYAEYIRAVVYAGMYPEIQGREDEYIGQRIHQHGHPSPPVEITLLSGARKMISNYPMPDGGLVIIATDVTELKAAEAERENLREQLRQSQKMETIGVMAGGIAHDFNNILSPILGHAELTLDRLTPDDPIRGHLESIQSAAVRAAELVQQMLTFGRQGHEERKPIELVPIVTEALRLIRAAIPSSIEIRERLDPACAMISANPGQIHQIVLNLCANAAQAIGQKSGAIDVTLAPFTVDAELASKTVDAIAGDYVQLSVKDDGPGIDAVTRARIFDPFFTTKAAGQGTGLGLSVVHGIVTGLDGHINIDSAPGLGARFDIRLPALAPSAAPAEQPQVLPVGGGERIFLIDDEPAIAKMAKDMLAPMGYQVEAFTSSLDALAAFDAAADTVDLVITDKTMPEMTGDDLARKLREIRGDIPIIMVTGFGGTSIIEDHNRGIISDVVKKPFSRRTLDQAIRRALDGPDRPGE